MSAAGRGVPVAGGEKMNQYQRIAYQHPCFEAEETANLRFFHTVPLNGGRWWSVGLTANIGLE
jgi:hypothetical protein